MTEDEHETVIETAAYLIRGDDGLDPFGIARAILTPMFAKIAMLEAENDALRQRLVVDDAMIERAKTASASKAMSYMDEDIGPFLYHCMRAALTAALANKDDPK